jgi:pantoate kinase
MAIPAPSAFSPGSVTCFFVPSVGASVEETSSPGCGINISMGVTAAVQPGAEVVIRLNGQVMDFPPVRTVVEELAPEPVGVFLETSLPLGCGFGVSAAGSLTTAFALARRYALEASRQQLGMVALRAEIQHRTGIGDVPNQLLGGVVLRRWRTGPFDGQTLPMPKVPLYFKVFGSLSTRAILTNPLLVHQLAAEGSNALRWLEEHAEGVTLEQVLARSLKFAQEANLVTDARVIGAIEEVQARGGQATMVMLGQSVLANQPGEGDWQECTIDFEGTRFLS